MIPKTHKLIAAAAFAVSLTTISASAQILPPKPKTERVPIDLVVCLDTSGSMRGLLDSARQSIWSIVNDLALAEPAPLLRVALLTYGNNGHDKANGWVKLESGLHAGPRPDQRAPLLADAQRRHRAGGPRPAGLAGAARVEPLVRGAQVDPRRGQRVCRSGQARQLPRPVQGGDRQERDRQLDLLPPRPAEGRGRAGRRSRAWPMASSWASIRTRRSRFRRRWTKRWPS
jgi:hypothetical protein